MDYNPCFLIPCYNHGKSMPAILNALAEYDLPCYVVDDGSSLPTTFALDDLNKKYEWLHLIRHEHNRGKGGAVMTGMCEAWRHGFTHVVQVDADGQHDLKDLPVILKLSRDAPSTLVSGRPVFDESVPKSRLCGRYITHTWVWLETLSTVIKDSMCGFRAYPLTPCIALFNQVRLGRRMDFDVEVMVRLFWKNVPVKFFDTRVIYPKDGVSHFKLFQDNLLISWMHTRLFCGMLIRLPKLIWGRFFRQSHWSIKKERGGIFGLKLMLWAYRTAGRGVFSLLLYPVMAYFWLTGSQERKASKDYLRRIRAHAITSGRSLPKGLNSFRHFLTFGHSILDKAAAWNGEIKLDDVDFPSADLYRKVVASGQGIMVIGSHLGNLELCRALGDDTGDVQINSIVFTHHAEQFNQLLKSVNPRANVNLIQVSEIGPDTAILLKQKIDDGEWVVIVADRTPLHMKKSAVEVDFLGDKAAFPQGPFVLASLMKCPVYLMFGLNEKDGLKIYFEFLSEPLVLPRAGRVEYLRSIVQSFADRLAYHCMNAPLDWFNFFDFWKGKNEKDKT